uniref:Uncharacterized protein n=1 Tax=Arundo donax TaxID=35708 RepID=A0A0A9DTP3_ARUDO
MSYSINIFRQDPLPNIRTRTSFHFVHTVSR